MGATSCETHRGLQAGVDFGWLDDADSAALLRAYGLCWQVLQAARLLGDKPLDPDRIGEGAVAFVLRETGFESVNALRDALDEAVEDAAGSIDRALGRLPEDM